MEKLFWILTIARWFSELGDWFNYMVQLTIIEDYKYISIMIAIRNIVPFIISPFVGNYVESHDQIIIIIISQIILLITSAFIYVAYLKPEYWYLTYVYVFLQAICVCIKSCCYQYIIPNVCSMSNVEKANKIQALSQASVYIVGMGLGGIILSVFGDISNLIIDNIVYFISTLIMIYFKFWIRYNNIDIYQEKCPSYSEISFRNGLLYMYHNSKFPIMIMVNAITYYVYGIAEIINFKLGFEEYGVLILSIVLGLSTTGTIILYFWGSHKYGFNYVILILAISFYAIIEKKHIIPIWFFGLWMFTYVHYAFQIMMTTMIHKEADPNYKGRLFTYYYGSTLILYAMGSFTGSYFYPWYWILIIISIVLIGILLIKYRYNEKSPDKQKLISLENITQS